MRTLLCLILVGLASLAEASYKCVDAKGATHFGDSPPPACADAVTFELSSSGSVVRRIDPLASASAVANAATDKQAADKVAAMRRQDRALLDSYTSVQEIDRARDRSLEMTRSRIDSTDVRLQQLAKREKELPRAGPHLDAVRAEAAGLAASKARLEKDLEETQRRFEADRARWLELRAAR
jgi:hypothetical protein